MDKELIMEAYERSEQVPELDFGVIIEDVKKHPELLREMMVSYLQIFKSML